MWRKERSGCGWVVPAVDVGQAYEEVAAGGTENKDRASYPGPGKGVVEAGSSGLRRALYTFTRVRCSSEWMSSPRSGSGWAAAFQPFPPFAQRARATDLQCLHPPACVVLHGVYLMVEYGSSGSLGLFVDLFVENV